MGDAKIYRDMAWDDETMEQFMSASGKMLEEITSITQFFSWDLVLADTGMNFLPQNDRHASLEMKIHELSGNFADSKAQNTKKKIDTVTESVLSEGHALDKQIAGITTELGSNFDIISSKANHIISVLSNPLTVPNAKNLAAQINNLKRSLDEGTKSLLDNITDLRLQLNGAEVKENFYSKDPVNLSTGNFIYEHTDLHIGGEIELAFSRFYNSVDRTKTSLGRCYTHNYDLTLEVDDELVKIKMHDGGRKLFAKLDDGKFKGVGSTKETLSLEKDKYVLTNMFGYKWTFDEAGKIVREENVLGRGKNFSYDNDGRLVKVIADHGAFLQYKYQGDLLVEVSDCFNRTVGIDYSNDKVSRVTLADGSVYNYNYGETGRITEVKNTRGVLAVVNQYDNQNRVIHQEFPDGGTMEFEYDDENGVVTLTERDGSIIKYVHDELYRSTDIIFEDGTSEHFQYNDKNQRSLVKDRNGNVTRFAYDERGNVTQVVNAKKDKINYTYNAQNKIVSVKVNGREQVKNSYDAMGNLVETIERNSAITRISYDAQGRPEKIISADSRVTTVEHDANGNIISVQDENGATIKYEYDELNRVVRTIDAKGNSIQYEYGANDKLAKTIDKAGNVRNYTYNEAGKVTEVVDYDGYKTSASYNALGKVANITDKEGNVTSYDYDKMWNISQMRLPNGGCVKQIFDKNNRLEQVILPEGGVVCYEYDGAGNRISQTDPEGNVTRYRYDELNRIVEVEDALGYTLKCEYDSEGHIVKEINQQGNETCYIYDEKSNQVSTKIDVLGNKTSYEYDVMGRITKVVYPNGSAEEFVYSNGKLAKHINVDNTFICYEYDVNGNCIKTVDNTGRENHLEYDCLDRMVKATTEDGSNLWYEYDSIGRVVCITDAKNNKTKYEYTPNGNLSRVIDAKGYATAYAYDSLGRLVKVEKYGEGNVCQTTSYEWNLEGRLTKRIDPLGNEESFAYDRCGNLTEKIDKDGNAIAYSYNKLGLIEKIAYSDGNDVTMIYDELRKLKEVQNATGVVRLTNDALGRTISITDEMGNTTGYEWGSLGEKTAIRYPNGKRADYIYDKYSRLEGLNTEDGLIRYSYDELGRLNEKILPNNVTTKYSYNNSGRIAAISHSGNDILEEYKYTYDSVGNTIAVSKNRCMDNVDNGDYGYEYDELNRLVSVSKNGNILREYEYDAFGNRTKLTSYESNQKIVTDYTFNAHNQLVTSVSENIEEHYSYDKRGNLVEVMDSNSMYKRYNYNGLNKLYSVESNMNEGTKKSTYSYNAFGQRISKSVYQEENLIKNVKYVVDITKEYNNVLAIEEMTNNNSSTKNFIWDSNVVAMNEADINSYYIQDDIGSTMMLTSSNGSARESYAYGEFGQSLVENSDVQPFSYIGYQLDEVSGLYYAQARRYDANIGRFTSEDLFSGMLDNPASQNRYLYCWNRPMDYVDANGKFPVIPILIIAAVVAVASIPVSIGVASSTDKKLKKEASITEPQIDGYTPDFNVDNFNAANVINNTNCYAYALGLTKNPITNEAFPNGGLQLGMLSNDYYYRKAQVGFISKMGYEYMNWVGKGGKTSRQQYLSGTDKSKENLVQVVKNDCNAIGLNFEEYKDGMTGGIRVALVAKAGDYHWYVYNDKDNTWYGKHGFYNASNKNIISAGGFSVTEGDTMAGEDGYLDDMEYWQYNLVGEFYYTAQNGMPLEFNYGGASGSCIE